MSAVGMRGDDGSVMEQREPESGARELPSPFTTDDARAYIAEVRWQFAKTMPQWPHEYTVRKWRPDLERDFLEFVVLIRRDGIVKPWPRDAATPRYRLTYLELDGWEYWSMGAPVPETTVINRALLTQEATS
jgi:hypothetical protein